MTYIDVTYIKGSLFKFKVHVLSIMKTKTVNIMQLYSNVIKVQTRRRASNQKKS
jgi:hypothetical protein